MALQNDSMNKQQTQKRILIATVLSFAFFIAYDFLYLQPKQALVDQANAQNVVALEKKNKLTQSSTNAPITSVKGVTNTAPSANVSSNNVVTTIKTLNNVIEIDNLGRISQVILSGKQYVTEDDKHIKLFDVNQLKPLEVRFSNRKINEEAFSTNITVSATNIDATNVISKLIITQKLTDTTLTKLMTFYPDGHYDIKASSTNNAEFFITTGYRPNVLVDMYADHGALLVLSDETLNIIEDEDMDKNQELVGVNVASAFDRYYASVLYNYDIPMSVSIMKDLNDSPQMFIHAKNNIFLHGYAGPKEHKILQSLDNRLTSVIEYGWFTFIAQPMFILLQFIHDYVGNWGWTIVFTTILIKLVLFPLSHKGMVSMNRLKELAPKVKALQEKYKGDKQKSSMHMMELYKKEGANPMGGCLPVILQIPVFFAIYRVLLNSIELKGAPWMLWIDDLGVMDPYFILPILMGTTMFVQQKITPNTMADPMQQKLFQLLPVVFTFFFLWFPAGLTLYWFINNLFTIVQQYYVNTIFKKAKIKRHEKHLEEKIHDKKD
ncbi:MAG: YidC/Oxa1 family membrane protein insertase [Arcobacteraceae bacterium]|jgi:YidC/Oxa1 family membrane protein insertase